MPLSNSPTQYGAISKVFHWLTALMILGLIPLGIYANQLPYDSSEALAHKAWMFSLHKTLGVTLFMVALARILWALTQPKPAPLHPDRRVETLAAATVHWLLYGSLLAVPLSGWIHHAATEGFAPIWWPLGQDLPMVPKSETLAGATAGLHIVFERVLVLSILLHVAGALKHHLIDRDATLRRMLPGRTAIAPPAARHAPASRAPLAAALAVWALALGIGGTLGLYARHDGSVQAAALAAVQSDWAVTDGALEITVRQLGSGVTGRFSDWTAAIRFDESVETGAAGSVEVVVAIGSLTLGSVTPQALGPGYFEAQAFPTATYAADILRTADGYLARGTLTIKDIALPLDLPFTLDLTDGTARMTGATSLDRRDYRIGMDQTDAGTLGFDVGINVALTALRAD